MQGQSIIHATWLSNPAFYVIFAPAGPLDPQVDQKHMTIVHDAKRPDNSADVVFPINFFPSGTRLPGAFTVVLKGWDPAKFLLLVGDSTTADIGLVCCTADDKWQKLSFDEGAPSMPLDADQNETTMIGFELDLKNTTPYDVTTSTGETVSVPPPPIVWAYASDGTVTAWYIVNTRGTQYPSMGQAAALSPVTAPAAPAMTSPFSQMAQPAFGQTSQPTFGQSSQPSLTFAQPAFGQASLSGSAFGQSPTFGGSAFGQTSAVAQPTSSGQATSGAPFASFASAPAKWGQAGFGSTAFHSAGSLAPPPQIQLTESTESMSTDSSQDLTFSAMSLGEGSNDSQQKAGLGTTSMFGAPTPTVQPAVSSPTTSTFGGGSFTLAPGVGAFAKLASKPTDEVSSAPAVEGPKPSSAFGQTGFGAPAFGQSGFGQSGLSKTGLGTPMSTTPIVTPVSTTSPSTFGSGGPFSAFASGGTATLSGSKQAETKPGAPATSGGGGFGAFASGGLSAFGQAASTTPSSMPAWKTGGDGTFGGGTGSTVFGTSSTSPLESTTTPVKPLFASAEPAASTTPAFSPPATTSLETAASSFSSTTPSTSPFDTATPSSTSKLPAAADSTPPTSPPTEAKTTSLPASTTPAGPPPVPNAFAGLMMSTGHGLSNFNSKDSPFANPKPVSQTISAFGGGQPPAPKMPVPATPGSVFGQTSSIGTASKPVPAFGQPAFGSPSTTPTGGNTTPSSSKFISSNAFSAFSGVSSVFGKSAGSASSFSDMLRNAGSSPESAKSKETPKTPESGLGPTPATPKSVFDKSPTPRPATIPAAPDSEDEEEGEKDQDEEPKVVSAASSFSNLSSSTSSFVDVAREHEEDEKAGEAPSGDGEAEGEQGEQQIDEFLSDTDEEREASEEEQEGGLEGEGEGEGEGDDEFEEEGVQAEEGSEEEENDEPPPDEADPTVIPLPKSRSPSSTPKAERPLINVQPTLPPKPDPQESSTSRIRSTTPPGSPSNEPLSLEQPMPTLPSPSLTPSPVSSIGLGRPSTRPLRSSPLANTPVSGGDEEEVKGENSPSVKPRPASPKTPFGQWDTGSKATSPSPAEARLMPPPAKAEPLVDHAVKPPASSATASPKTPPLLAVKGTAPNDKPPPPFATPAVTKIPVPTPNWSGSPPGGAPKPDDATIAVPSLFKGMKPGTFGLMPKPEPSTEAPSAPDSTFMSGSLFEMKPPAVLGPTTKPPVAPGIGSAFGTLPGAIPGATAPDTGLGSISVTPSRTQGDPSLITPPKEISSKEPMHQMQVEFTSLYTEVGTEMAKVC